MFRLHGLDTWRFQRHYSISILDRYEEMATARVDSPDWIDYLHLARLNGRWVIANVLYTARPAKS